MKKSVEKFLEKVQDIFFPRGITCLSCGKELTDDDTRDADLCKECFQSLTFLEGDICPKCATKLEDGICPNCHNYSFSFDRTITSVKYQGLARSMVIDFKDADKNYLYRTMLYFMPPIEEHVDIVTFVPSSKKAIRKRGYDHAEILAKGYGKKVGLPVLRLLCRTKENRDSAELNRAERVKNIKNAFSVTKATSKVTLKDKTVIIIDDVMTTGMTIDECAKLLKKEGAKRVIAVVFSRS